MNAIKAGMIPRILEMTMSNKAMVVYNQFDTMQRAALALQTSGYFPDVRSEAQAIAKVMAGAELGLPPFASMAGIHIVQGKPVLGSNVIATLVKNDPRYDYRIKQVDNEACILEWYEDGKQVGEAGFTFKEATNAGLTNKPTWKNYRSDMLFARAISRGARRFAPGIFGGSPVYTPDELDIDTDSDGYIESQQISHEPIKYNIEDANADFFDNKPEQETEHEQILTAIIENHEGVLSRLVSEIVVKSEEGAELVPYYKHEKHIKGALKKLGFAYWPAGFGDEQINARLTMYGELCDYAVLRNSGMDSEAAIDAVKQRMFDETGKKASEE